MTWRAMTSRALWIDNEDQTPDETATVPTAILHLGTAVRPPQPARSVAEMQFALYSGLCVGQAIPDEFSPRVRGVGNQERITGVICAASAIRMSSEKLRTFIFVMI